MADTRWMERVIADAVTGDRDALAELWRGHQHLLLRYFRGKGMAEPEDLASIVWIEVAKGLPSFEGGAADFRRWLFTIASRRRVDEIRRHRRHRDRDEAARAAATERATNETVEEFERSAALDRAIALVRTLPSDQAEAVLLRVVADLNVADVAAIMNRSEGSVRVLVHRGLSRLSERIEPAADTVVSTPGRITPDVVVTNSGRRSIYAV
jgi:RNA polymerase sigma-70 factor, ECF subfamily